ncbi:hypothetical protein ACIQXM_01850 [Arthrobacter sp. NPDC097144]|uniref:hypothetical protein n=1 Tax=Arthrobacter sp. NPDC097144 TaxID=3363946 RepID=UPI00380AA7E0
MSADYYITLSGCDDKTEIVLNLDDDQVGTLRKFATRINQRSEFSCQPKMKITEATQGQIEADTEAAAEVAKKKESQS